MEKEDRAKSMSKVTTDSAEAVKKNPETKPIAASDQLAKPGKSFSIRNCRLGTE